MDNIKLAELLFPNVKLTREELEKKFPERKLKDGAIVTRFAPSPTGFLHMGSAFTCLVASRFAKSSGGLFLLRLEDTDQTREIPGAVKIICEDLKKFNIEFDEGRDEFGKDFGEYGPYRQSERKEIYMVMAKQLVEEGKAYPCFCTKEITDHDREIQEKNKELLGYYGHYAHCRNLSFEEIAEKVKAGKPFAIRLKVNSSPNNKIVVKDAIRGELKLSDNYNDVVVLKSDFLPPYNFAHACDDHFMRVNLVMRGDEYIPSIAEHLQIFNALNFDEPQYAHVSPIQKMDGESKRKISKRYDPEARVSFYEEMGYPFEAVIEYLMTIANSNFEDWRKTHQNEDSINFPITLNKMSISGALFDFNKLNDVAKNVISRFSAQKLYELSLNWAKGFDNEMFELLTKYKDFSTQMLNIERESIKPRKDIACFSQIKNEYGYFFKELFKPNYEFDERFSKEEIIKIVELYLNTYNENDEKDVWFNKIKELGKDLNIATDMKEYKANPQNFKAHYGDTSSVIRMAFTGRKNTPDLYEICKLLGKPELLKRFEMLKK